MIVVAYEHGGDNAEEKTICISPRRKTTIKVKKDSEVVLLIHSLNGFYLSQKLDFSEKGEAKVYTILDENHIIWEASDSEVWKDWKKSIKNSEVYVGENGFYLSKYRWMDCDSWLMMVFLKDVVKLEDKSLITFRYEHAFSPVNKNCQKFLQKMITKGCSEKEYLSAKEKYLNPERFENMLTEIFQK